MQPHSNTQAGRGTVTLYAAAVCCLRRSSLGLLMVPGSVRGAVLQLPSLSSGSSSRLASYNEDRLDCLSKQPS